MFKIPQNKPSLWQLKTFSHRYLPPEDIFAAELVCREWRATARQCSARRGTLDGRGAASLVSPGSELHIKVKLCPAAADCVRRLSPGPRTLLLGAQQAFTAPQLVSPTVESLKLAGYAPYNRVP